MVRLVFAAITVAATGLAGFASAAPNASTTAAAAVSGTCSRETDVDYSGMDIAQVRGAAADCCEKCQAHEGCRAYTWSSWEGGTCFLKSERGATKPASGLISGTVTTTSPNELCIIEYGVDYIGNDVGSVREANFNKCCDHCANEAKCGAYSWTGWNGGTCWLKSEKGGQTKQDDGIISGVVNRAKTCKTRLGVDYEGHDLQGVPGEDPGACCSLCRATDKCKVFTWTDWNGGTCWLKTRKGAIKNTPGAVSGVVGADYEHEMDIDYYGADLKNVLAPSADDCQGHCDQLAGCATFTWTDWNGGTCWLKSGKGTRQTLDRAVSAFKSENGNGGNDSVGHIQPYIRMGMVRAKSVNLGSWLVGEQWMSYRSPMWKNAENTYGEYQTMKALTKKIGREAAIAQFEEHRRTWITERDIQEIASYGLNTVRVPVGFWIVNDDPSTVKSEESKMYAPGALKYLDTLINDWAVKHNVAVMLSLHAHQGSQNGYDHSSPSSELGEPKWRKSWPNATENAENSLQFATFLAARYKDKVAFLGLNLMNEPTFMSESDMEKVKAYYLKAYDAIRATGNMCIIGTSPDLYQQGPPHMADFMLKPKYKNVWHEFHLYFAWNHNSLDSVFGAAKTYRERVLGPWNGNPIYMGEWSLATPGDIPITREQRATLARIQLEAFDGAKAGYAFWSWRNDDDLKGDEGGVSPWSMRHVLRTGILTLPK